MMLLRNSDVEEVEKAICIQMNFVLIIYYFIKCHFEYLYAECQRKTPTSLHSIFFFLSVYRFQPQTAENITDICL